MGRFQRKGAQGCPDGLDRKSFGQVSRNSTAARLRAAVRERSAILCRFSIRIVDTSARADPYIARGAEEAPVRRGRFVRRRGARATKGRIFCPRRGSVDQGKVSSAKRRCRQRSRGSPRRRGALFADYMHNCLKVRVNASASDVSDRRTTETGSCH